MTDLDKTLDTIAELRAAGKCPACARPITLPGGPVNTEGYHVACVSPKDAPSRWRS